ncbi:hypothetical protein, partial [Bacillus cereus]
STFSLSIEEKSPKARGVVEHASRSSSSHEEGYTERPKIPEERIRKQISDINKYSKELQNYVYMTFEDLDTQIGEPFDEGLRK